MILWSGKKEQQDAKKRWEEELVKDYPEMVSRLGLLLEAGMSLRQAWKKLTDTYESKRKKQRLPKRAGYEEMLLTRRELEDASPHRSPNRSYARLSPIPSSNSLPVSYTHLDVYKRQIFYFSLYHL